MRYGGRRENFGRGSIFVAELFIVRGATPGFKRAAPRRGPVAGHKETGQEVHLG